MSLQRDKMHVRLAIACPMANEMDSAERFVGRVLEVCRAFPFERVRFFAVFDQVCTDGTSDRMKELSDEIDGLVHVWAPENRCVVDAYLRGYRAALDWGADWILEIDAGFSHQPEDIPKFFRKMARGYDCVFGSRFRIDSRVTDNSLKRTLVSRAGTVAANFLLGTRLTDMTSGFELFRREALERILDKGIASRGPFFQTEIRTFAHGLNVAEVPIHYRAASHNVGGKALKDALHGLKRLVDLRRKDDLFLKPPEDPQP